MGGGISGFFLVSLVFVLPLGSLDFVDLGLFLGDLRRLVDSVDDVFLFFFGDPKIEESDGLDVGGVCGCSLEESGSTTIGVPMASSGTFDGSAKMGEPKATPDIAAVTVVSTTGVVSVRGTVRIVVVKGSIEESRTVAEAANTISCSLWVSCSTPDTSDSAGRFKRVVAAIIETVSPTIKGTVSTAGVDSLADSCMMRGTVDFVEEIRGLEVALLETAT